ncbi:hypothetical protein PRIPAC_78647 [Pristionchus pacificus]|uniref:Uncharacterized protein n=1 Tax=Pristionchus pacificus TaxID=54126 RepID=A0A2A6CQ33_PRIPA|nr:hypothetical protein PRIPAC_77148 [Pristionchus pacificus]KAF8372218.1 hypothetical protein PRIPAC_78647 [Pristionchus pacificus]|eukprot:PDM79892.1 hypothetical protein PRIPAC_32471 [Pristionchus pacificus]
MWSPMALPLITLKVRRRPRKDLKKVSDAYAEGTPPKKAPKMSKAPRVQNQHARLARSSVKAAPVKAAAPIRILVVPITERAIDTFQPCDSFFSRPRCQCAQGMVRDANGRSQHMPHDPNLSRRPDLHERRLSMPTNMCQSQSTLQLPMLAAVAVPVCAMRAMRKDNVSHRAAALRPVRFEYPAPSTSTSIRARRQPAVNRPAKTTSRTAIGSRAHAPVALVGPASIGKMFHIGWHMFSNDEHHYR